MDSIGAAILGINLSGQKLESFAFAASLTYGYNNSTSVIETISHKPLLIYAVNADKFLVMGGAITAYEESRYYIACEWVGTTIKVGAYSKDNNVGGCSSFFHLLLIG